MKCSRYNIFFPYNDIVVGYNSLQNDFIFLSTELYELYNQTLSENINGLADIHPDFWKLLVDKNFFVEDDTDELQNVKDLVHSIDCNPETYILFINPTMNCNFKCWYCYETQIKGSKMDQSVIEKIKKNISNKYEETKFKYLTISWFGGEPLLYFKQVVLPILNYANEFVIGKDICLRSEFTTNGYLLNKEILEHCKQLGVNHFQITLDGHRNRHNQVRFTKGNKGSYDVIVANIQKCIAMGIAVNCRINLSKETLTDDLAQIINDFSDISEEDKKYLQFSFFKVWQDNSLLNTEIFDLIQQFKDNNLPTKPYHKYNDTVRNPCYGDRMHHATINYNGDVFKCTARDFKKENREGVLLEDGNIQWNDKYFRRMDAKFKNPCCLSCKILPICNGVCTQHLLENNQDWCYHDLDENKKIEVVREKLLYVLE